MNQIIIIKSNGEVVEKQFMNIREDTLHKICGISDKSNIIPICSFEGSNINIIHLFGIMHGETDAINELILPVPISDGTYYGPILVISTRPSSIDKYDRINIDYDLINNYTISEWEKDYEKIINTDINQDTSDDI